MGRGRQPLGSYSPTNPSWDPTSKDFAGNMGFTKDDGKGGRVAIGKDDVYQLKDGTWLPIAGNEDAQRRIAADKLEREKEAQEQKLQLDRQVAEQSAMALKQVSRKKSKPKGGTILTSPTGLGGLGTAPGQAKTLIGA